LSILPSAGCATGRGIGYGRAEVTGMRRGLRGRLTSSPCSLASPACRACPSSGCWPCATCVPNASWSRPSP
jgi:hypothetical protein